MLEIPRLRIACIEGKGEGVLLLFTGSIIKQEKGRQV